MRPQVEPPMTKQTAHIVRRAESRIIVLRGQRVILDADLAELYGVPAKRLNEQIKRNADRFPPDFLFRLSRWEYQNLRSQIATSSSSHGGRRYLPLAFAEHGVIMAATVLNSKRAIQVSLFVVRAFVRIREVLNANRQIVVKLAEIDRRLEGHDSDIHDLVETIRKLMSPPPANNRRIGFEIPPAGDKSRSKLLRSHAETPPREDRSIRMPLRSGGRHGAA